MADERKTNLSLPQALSLQGRLALVVGAAGGIGRATALCLAELGADLVVADRSPMDSLCREIEALGRSASALQGDLTDDAFLDRIVARGPYYSFAYTAGVFRRTLGTSKTQESFDFVMHINVRAPMVLGYSLIEQAAPDQGGYMVIVGSSAGRSGTGGLGEHLEYTTYAASKGGVNAVARALASKGASKNILVNTVAPGVVYTPMLDETAPHLRNNNKASPLGRGAYPREIGWPIALLCSPAASFMSGALLYVNGGSAMG
jgi:3-oxoacyl-[acyl-carrier protein] reductase